MVPTTSFPACPTAVEGGQPGISLLRNGGGIFSSESANPPRPLPSTTASRGPNRGFMDSMKAAAIAHSKIPAIQADMKFAIVPAATARSPRRARSDLRLGANAPIPPTCMAIELKLAKPHNA